MLPRPVSLSGLRQSLPGVCPFNHRGKDFTTKAQDGRLSLGAAQIYSCGYGCQLVSNRAPRRVNLRANTNTLTRDYSTRRLFSSTTSCRAVKGSKAPIKPSRTTKSLFGAPKTPGTATPKPQKTVTTYSEYGNDVYSSLARATLPPETEVEPEDITLPIKESNADIIETEKSDKKQKKASNAASSDEPAVSSELESAPAKPSKKSSKLEADAPTVASSPDTSGADNVSHRPAKLAGQKSQHAKLTQTQTPSEHGVNRPPSPLLALVAVSCVEERPIHLEEFALWMSKFGRLIKDVDRFISGVKTIRHQIKSFELNVKDHRRILRLRELKRFETRLQFMLDCVAERVALNDVLSARFSVLHSGLAAITRDLRKLHAVTGKPIYDEYFKLIWIDRSNSQLDSHNWRRILRLRLKVDGPLATNEDGRWVYNRVEMQAATFKSCFETSKETRTILNGIYEAKSEAISNPETLALMRRLSKTNRTVLDFTAELRDVMHRQTFKEFFLPKHRSNIHWKQLDFYVPFENNTMSYYMLRVLIGDACFFIDDVEKWRQEPRMSQRWKRFLDTFLRFRSVMHEIELLQDELFEINWIRLKLRELTGEIRRKADLRMRRPLSASPRCFEEWLYHRSDIHFATARKEKEKHPTSSMQAGQSAGVNTEDQLEPEEVAGDEFFPSPHQILPFQPAHTSSPFPSYWSHKYAAANEDSQKPEEPEAEMIDLFDDGGGIPATGSGHSKGKGKGKDTEKTLSRAASRQKGRRLLSPKSSRKKPKPTPRTPKRAPREKSYYHLDLKTP